MIKKESSEGNTTIIVINKSFIYPKHRQFIGHSFVVRRIILSKLTITAGKTHIGIIRTNLIPNI